MKKYSTPTISNSNDLKSNSVEVVGIIPFVAAAVTAAAAVTKAASLFDDAYYDGNVQMKSLKKVR